MGRARAWERVEAAVVADCRVYQVLRERWRETGQLREADFYVIEVGDWAVALGETPAGKWVLVRQWRFGSGAFSLEFPAGVVDAGEDPVEAARRELYEESGYKAEGGEVIGVVAPNPALQRNRCHFVYFGRCERVDGGAPEGHESFDVVEMAPAAVRAAALGGGIEHGIVHAALFFMGERGLGGGRRT